ncbi:MAG: hypothetical protein VB071_09750 [Lawsonibacter sp.]|nr:hypothetical protein [Lawsonibacter sp.]
MEQTLDRAAAEVPQIDPETFRRVWERVMPDQKNSPIVVKPSEGNSAPAPLADAPLAGRKIQPETTASESGPDTGTEAENGEQDLRQLIDMAAEGAEAAQALARRAGSGSGPLSGLMADHRRALRQLSAAYFLETGQRYQPKRHTPVRSKGLIQALREQYLWEQRWALVCLQTAKRVKEPSIQDLCRELAQDASLHNCAIRRVLEQKM